MENRLLDCIDRTKALFQDSVPKYSSSFEEAVQMEIFIILSAY